MVRLAGGCQCGAVRFALRAQPHQPCVCTCRMCQKATGSVLPAFAGVNFADFELTRGEIAWWRSSSTGERGFCRGCGTPLAWVDPERTYIAFTAGSFDEPERVAPIHSYGAESRVGWLEAAAALPSMRIGIDGRTRDWPHESVRRTNRQHPDRDTEAWPPEHGPR